jgi:hypothetical protein
MSSVMADNYHSVIAEITHGPYQCREAGELARASSENENGTKLRAQFIFGAGALGVVLITLATRAIIRAAADREADRGVPRPPANILRQ